MVVMVVTGHSTDARVASFAAVALAFPLGAEITTLRCRAVVAGAAFSDAGFLAQ